LRAIQSAFRSLRAEYDWRFDSWRAPWRRWQRTRRWFSQWFVPALSGAALGTGALTFIDLSERFGSWDLAWRHMLSAPSCSVARAQGLAPALRGRPGYYEHHDRDGDGVACEGYRRR
jgi:hypothetical protein